jgi:hypothetical protein
MASRRNLPHVRQPRFIGWCASNVEMTFELMHELRRSEGA